MEGNEVFQEMPLTGRIEGENNEKPPLYDFVQREMVVSLTNLFDELAKKYEGLSTKSDNGLEFAEELSTRMEEIFEGQSNEVIEAIKASFGKIGEVAEADLGFALEEERSLGNYMSPEEKKILEWFDSQRQREMLAEMVAWQHNVMRMVQWLGMLDGGDALVSQFSERWREFGGKRLGHESAEAFLRGIAGPLLFSKLCDEAGYEVFLPEVAWDRDDKIDLLIRNKDREDLVFMAQLKARRAGDLGVAIEGKSQGSELSGRASKEKESLLRSVGRMDQVWSRDYGISLEPVFVTIEGVGEGQEMDLMKDLDENIKENLVKNISSTLRQIGRERLRLPMAA